MRKAIVNGASARTAFGATIIAALLLAVMVAEFWTPYNPIAIDLRATLAPPSAAHWLGTDEFGRDVMSRVLAGAKLSVRVALATALCAVTLGSLIGAVAGFFRGRTDAVLMATTNAILAFPSMLLSLGVVAVLGSSESSIIIALSMAYSPAVVRLVRAVVLSIRERDFVEASRVMGNSPLYSLARHVAPNAAPQVVVLATNLFGWAVLSESALSFLGVGIPPPAPTWGNMLASARPYLDSAAWLAVAPGVCIAVTLLGINFLGDALRDHLSRRSEM